MHGGPKVFNNMTCLWNPPHPCLFVPYMGGLTLIVISQKNLRIFALFCVHIVDYSNTFNPKVTRGGPIGPTFKF